MLKKILIVVSLVLFVLAILVTGGIIYLNNVFLPKTIRVLIVKSIAEQTNSRVSLGALRVNIFKGLVLNDLKIYKQENEIVRIKEASCIFLPFPVFRKQLIIPIINIKSAQIFLERREDNTFNLEDLFLSPSAGSAPGGAPVSAQPGLGSPKTGFNFSIYRINISNAKITFRDATFSPAFVKTIENINLTIYLSLPAAVKFKFSALIPAGQPVNLGAYGEYKIASRELNSRLTVNNFSPGDFAVYYGLSGLKITGLLNATFDLKMKDNILSADTRIQSKNLNIQQENISVKADTSSRVILEYGLSDKKLKYSGNSRISNALISGLEFVDTVSAVNCGLIFNNLGLSTEDLTASIFGIPVRAKVILSNFKDPALSINANSSLSLAALQAALRDKLKLNFPGTINGQGNLSLALDGPLKEAGGLALNAWLDLVDADVKLTGLDFPLRGINGRIAFTRRAQQAFPLLDISIKSDTLSLTSVLSLQDKLIKVSKCSGRYFSSGFSIAGNINTANPPATLVDLGGELRVDLKDLKYALPKFKEQLDKIKPEGKLKAQFNLSGNISDLKGCAVSAQFSSDTISLYGLRGTDLSISYAQADGLANVEAARLSLYNGSLDLALAVNFKPKDTPYLFTAALQGVEIKELKKDTLAKNKDISGIIQGDVRLSGSLGDLASSQGAGKVAITKGKLWELDLFNGLGKLLFSQEFANIVFSEGSCAFNIHDKAISTDELMLKSNMLNLSGPVKIGFDSSLNAKLNVDIISDLIPLTGTFKDVTTALVGQGEKFAVITVSGTLKEPKYKFQAAIADIIKGLADSFLRKI